MNMEGTKHEKAVLVILAYVVGFTSGFIAFGLREQSLQDYDTPYVQPLSVENVETAEEADLNTVPEIAPDTNLDTVSTTTNIEASAAYTNHKTTGVGTEVFYENDRLFVSVNGDITLLSVAKSKLTSTIIAAFASQGTHVTIPKYLASADGNFVFFCEQQTADDSCVAFVYDVQRKVIQFVSNQGQKVSVSAAVANSATWSENILTFGSFHSQAAVSPWLVTGQ